MFIEIQDVEGVFHIPEPWYIDRCLFGEEQKQLDVFIKFRKGALFTCPGCGAEAQPVKDIANHDQVWRHLNFAEYPIYFHAEHPRTTCGACNRILRVNVPWAIKPRAGFTLLFDAWIMAMAKDMPMNAISRLVKETDKRLWRILHYYVDNAIAAQDLSHVTAISTDETSAKRGQDYITIFMDPHERNVIHVTKGKDAATWKACKEHLEAHGGDAAKITEVCMDMSPAFIKGATENFPGAFITFDKFHVIKAANEAVDEVRRSESKRTDELKNTRYIWLKNEANLTKSQKETLDKLKDCELDTAKAYRELGKDDHANNHFLYESDTPEVKLRPDLNYSDHFPQANGDFFGNVCPLSAHIRKVNPRDSSTDVVGLLSSLTRRILRRGIPFGNPLKVNLSLPPYSDTENGNRGLMFLCYQTRIEFQFEFLTQRWANSPELPTGARCMSSGNVCPKPGEDPIIGQNGDDSSEKRVRSFTYAPNKSIDIMKEFVIPTGGEYYFQPSVDALKTVIGR